ncbi:hypothetical protein GCM10011391_06640 [Pullulanibacillus camelliae]|uniref:Uncharacterized protein n=1 Tax=Pullulanibacillus camelliae TaxID=1707096 RepID=A0A8J2YAV1_9BACL|nr:hypothetical protein [Pullulanibacillus camelliae]GGE30646.1 hypothetical protein GCM10011391_06640 [Pullulanibacillus camelliae]
MKTKLKFTLGVLALGIMAVVLFALQQSVAPQQQNAEREGWVTGLSAWTLNVDAALDSIINK